MAQQLSDNQQEVQLLKLWLSLIAPKTPDPSEVPTITSVDPFFLDPTTQLQVTWSPPSDGWNHFYLEVYENAGLTILNQVVEADTFVGTFSAVVGSAPPALSPGTQYWFRMKVRQDTSPYSNWSNTATGTTTP